MNHNSTEKTAKSWQPLFATNGSGRGDSHGVYSTVELQQLIEYERLQAERLGAPNALLVCNLNGGARDKRAVRRVVRTIMHTVRATDHIGWKSEEELAVLLPGASTQAADQLKSKLEDTGLSGTVELRVEAL